MLKDTCANCLTGILTDGNPNAVDFQRAQHVLCKLNAETVGAGLSPQRLDHFCWHHRPDPFHQPSLVTGAEAKKWQPTSSTLGLGVMDPDCF
ncbi:hypothetical protein [Bradyrhizobium cenepequi]